LTGQRVFNNFLPLLFFSSNLFLIR